ncbi:MAG TPA: hypothetical protein VFC44_20770 [Candidatus Saccharimonadales bacterium]|nr:hypothetical protein [Candidatus Saccharimonadales bacterium]
MATPKQKLPREFWWGGAVIALVFAFLTLETWRKWGDSLIDFGVQLYVPWKISTGTVLYRDVAYLTGGPLSQYYHALLFGVFGVSVLTLVVSNLVLLALLVALIYWSFYKASDALTAVEAALALLLVFAFAHYTVLGIFNYVTPYSAEIVHGLVLSVVMLAALTYWLTEKKPWGAALAGFCAGLVLLTKPEVFMAALAALGAAFFLGRRAGKLGRSAGLMLAGALVPLLGFFIHFCRLENFSESARSVFWAWTPMWGHSMAQDPFYRWCLGLDAPAFHLQMMGEQFLGLSAGLAVYVVLVRAVAETTWAKIVFVSSCVLAAELAWRYNWRQCGYCLLPLALVLLVLLLRRSRPRSNMFPILWTVFSLVLLAKLGLFVRIYHYGFALAMPAFLAAVYLLLWELPETLRPYRVRPLYLRGVVSVVLLTGFVRMMSVSLINYDHRTIPLGHGGDRTLVLPNRPAIAATLDWIETNTPPNSTLAVLPEGAMLNYLSRRTNPAKYLRWNSAELSVFGQENMDDAFTQNSPDYVILIERDMHEFGLKPFGEEERFGLRLKQWIDIHYKAVYAFDSPHLIIYRKK